MTKSNFFSVLLIISAIVFLPAKLSSQVSIGSTDAPQGFSVLELFSNETMGFRLPQLNNEQRIALTATLPPLDANGVSPAMGLQIFNTCNRCVETWNGREWISLCDGETPPIIINCDGSRMVVPQFAHFNLGGKEFATARAQMAYAASLEGTSSETCHGSLFGGRFQWGRADWAHAIGDNFTLWHGSGANDVDGTTTTAGDFHLVTGQPESVAVAGRFIRGGTNWLIAGHPAINNLWGNGVTIDTPTATGVPGMPGTDGEDYYFQSTSWVLPGNDPCPAGWRLPTQEEWELITPRYDCNPNAAPGLASNFINNTISPNDNSLFTWVRVSCREGVCTPTTTWSSATRNGFVLYLRSALPDDFVENLTTETNLLAANSPEPFLFLPAAGMRNNGGNVSEVDMGGFYWTSTLFNTTTNSRNLLFRAGNMNVGANNLRVAGLSVRCVRD